MLKSSIMYDTLAVYCLRTTGCCFFFRIPHRWSRHSSGNGAVVAVPDTNIDERIEREPVRCRVVHRWRWFYRCAETLRAMNKTSFCMRTDLRSNYELHCGGCGYDVPVVSRKPRTDRNRMRIGTVFRCTEHKRTERKVALTHHNHHYSFCGWAQRSASRRQTYNDAGHYSSDTLSAADSGRQSDLPPKRNRSPHKTQKIRVKSRRWLRTGGEEKTENANVNDASQMWFDMRTPLRNVGRDWFYYSSAPLGTFGITISHSAEREAISQHTMTQ